MVGRVLAWVCGVTPCCRALPAAREFPGSPVLPPPPILETPALQQLFLELEVAAGVQKLFW